MPRIIAVLLLSLALQPGGMPAQERPSQDMNLKILDEGMSHSQVMRTLHYLTDVYGPRLTGSPNYRAAAEWTLKQMSEWGLQNGHLEPWEFGHPGWTNERLSAHVLAPFKAHVACEVVAWTPSTRGAIAGAVFVLTPPDRPTSDQLTAYLDSVRSPVAGKIVFVGRPAVIPISMTPPAKRRDDLQVREQYDPNNPSPNPMGGPPQGPPPDPKILTANQITEKVDAFLLSAGALVKVTDSGREHGQLRVFGNRTYEPDKVIPAVVMRNEDYGRLSRIMADGTPLQMEFDILNHIYPEGRTTYNAVAEIPGTDKKDEVIMLGGHLDSWHAGTGATDDATGVTAMMEAVRILKVLGVQPRRTIRVALWSAEEQGLLGSQAYVKEHFGSFENPKPEFSKFGGYFNIDSGTGRLRGMSVFGPPEAAIGLREALKGFAFLGFAGAIASNSRRLGGTDSTSFNQAGLPGISCGQDPIEYQTHTWHTNLDTYERVLEDDLKAAAIVVAAGAYDLAMRDQLLARFPKEKMPAPPEAPRP
jgi:carboxypeptidase Q